MKQLKWFTCLSLLVLMCTTSMSCSKDDDVEEVFGGDDSIVGVWLSTEYIDKWGETDCFEFNFRENGTFSEEYYSIKDGSTVKNPIESYTGKWKTYGKNIDIMFWDSDDKKYSTTTYTYQVDGDKLTLTYDDGMFGSSDEVYYKIK